MRSPGCSAPASRSEFGQSFIVDNRGGGASIPGTRRSRPPARRLHHRDGRRAFVTNPGMFKDKLPYDTRKDFAPVSLLVRNQLLLVVPTESPFKPRRSWWPSPRPIPASSASPRPASAPAFISPASSSGRSPDRVRHGAVSRRRAGAGRLDLGKIDFAFWPSVDQPHLHGGKVRGLACRGAAHSAGCRTWRASTSSASAASMPRPRWA